MIVLFSRFILNLVDLSNYRIMRLFEKELIEMITGHK
jgi:hypothetical protein